MFSLSVSGLKNLIISKILAVSFGTATAPIDENRFEKVMMASVEDCASISKPIELCLADRESKLAWGYINATEFEYLEKMKGWTKGSTALLDAKKKPIGYCPCQISNEEGIPAGQQNRFEGNVIKEVRCQNIDDKECEEARRRPFLRNLISEQEYNYLKNWVNPVDGKIGAFPSLSFLDKERACPCGCFEPSTRIYVVDADTRKQSWTPIKDIVKEPEQFFVWSLDPFTTLEKFQKGMQKLQRISHGPETKPLIVIKTAGHRELAVTREHAVMLASGQMIEARKLKVDDQLLTYLGEIDSVVELGERTISEDVLNLETRATGYLAHVLFAEELTVGDLAWQNSLKSELEEVVIRQ